MPGHRWAAKRPAKAGGDELHLEAVGQAVLLDEDAGELGDVLAALPEGRHREGGAAQPVVDVFAEAPAAHELFDGSIGGGDEADVDAEGLRAADAPILMLEFFGVSLPYLEAMRFITLIYLVMAVVPSIALSELTVRGSVALYFLSPAAANPAAILAATSVLWLINLAIPAILGALSVFYFRLNR